jgi:hypothetical protein
MVRKRRSDAGEEEVGVASIRSVDDRGEEEETLDRRRLFSCGPVARRSDRQRERRLRDRFRGRRGPPS